MQPGKMGRCLKKTGLFDGSLLQNRQEIIDIIWKKLDFFKV
jgi:hypothetical protein